jgi:hypothetical protein
MKPDATATTTLPNHFMSYLLQLGAKCLGFGQHKFTNQAQLGTGKF